MAFLLLLFFLCFSATLLYASFGKWGERQGNPAGLCLPFSLPERFLYFLSRKKWEKKKTKMRFKSCALFRLVQLLASKCELVCQNEGAL